jgi:glycosyltransferase involved in cell wall biosynthesis
MTKVSIIVPCYNQAQFLDECLNSVVNQTNNDWECIIVNDGSQDNTNEIATLWTLKDSRFRYLFQENKGLSSSRNFGILNSQSDFILPLDADDKISPNYLEECLKPLIESENIKIVYGAGLKFGLLNEKWKLDVFSFDKLLKYNMIHCCAMFRKDDFIKSGGYDLNLIYGYEDWDLWINILKNGGSALQLNTCVFYYRVKEKSMITNLISNSNNVEFSKKYIFEKYLDIYVPDVYKLYLNYNKLAERDAFYTRYFKFFYIAYKKIIQNIHFVYRIFK